MNTLQLRPMENRWIRALLPALALSLCSCKPKPVELFAGGVPVREMTVTSRGFEPSRIEVPPGRPVVLRITRKVAETCADAVDVQGDPVRHMLPLDLPVDIKVTAPPGGQLALACPMNMIRAALVVVAQ